MRFKSANLSFKTVRSLNFTIGITLLGGVSLLSGLAAGTTSSWAALNLSPVAPYAFPDSDEDGVLEAVLRYAADDGNDVGEVVLMDESQGYINLDLTQGLDSSARDDDQQIYLDLTSTTTFVDESSSTLLISLFVTLSSSTTPVAIPIASIGGAACSASNCQGVFTSGGVDYFTAARAPSETQISGVRIGFYPKDICIGALAQNAAATLAGCTGTAIHQPTSSASTSFAITAAVDRVASTTTGMTYSQVDEKSSELSLILHGKALSYSCPAAEDIYFPGDSSVMVSTDFTVVGDSANAPADRLIVIADRDSLDETETFATGNELVGRFELGIGQTLFEGFENSTDGDPQLYRMNFAVRDVTGRLSPFGSDATCELTQVEASEVDGFLSANDCFIASAVFQSESFWAVSALREFRDQILRKTALGRMGIQVYYQHSPEWARVILKNPILRLPLAFVLIPLSGWVLLILHPVWVLTPMLTLMIGLLWIRKERIST